MNTLGMTHPYFHSYPAKKGPMEFSYSWPIASTPAPRELILNIVKKNEGPA
jgi:hypothetical protein